MYQDKTRGLQPLMLKIFLLIKNEPMNQKKK